MTSSEPPGIAVWNIGRTEAIQDYDGPHWSSDTPPSFVGAFIRVLQSMLECEYRVQGAIYSPQAANVFIDTEDEDWSERAGLDPDVDDPPTPVAPGRVAYRTVTCIDAGDIGEQPEGSIGQFEQFVKTLVKVRDRGYVVQSAVYSYDIAYIYVFTECPGEAVEL